jgi:serine/threonine-protein kinase
MIDIPREKNPQKTPKIQTGRLTGIIINKRYEIRQRIASGGMADVYVGQDLAMQRKVAIKILLELYSDSNNFISRFEKEAQILSKLKSPNIISVYDYGEFEGLYYIIMEFVNGSSLKELIESRGAFDPRTTARYSIQICAALELAHENNLIHRDIKPQNILIDKNEVLKVTDFGIAKFTTGDITKTINILGTAHYLSPEQAQGKILDNRTDIYSLGVLMYEMLVSDVPFRGGSSIDISIRHISEKPQPPSGVIKDIPARLEEIVMKCLEKNPDNRYTDIARLKNDLKNYLENRPISSEHIQKNGIKKNGAGYSSSAVYNYGQYMGGQVKKDTKNIPRYKKIMFGLISSSIIFCILFIVFISLFLISNSRLIKTIEESGAIEVPQLKNTEISSAIKILSAMDLELVTDNSRFDATIPQNFIIEQSPEPGTYVKKNAEIYVTVSSGAQIKYVTIPNLIAFDKDIAEKLLEEHGLAIGELIEEYNDVFNNGAVINQNPLPLNSVEINTPVNLTISKGRELVTIPDFTGYDYFYARSNLEALGLTVLTQRKTVVEITPGTIIEMDPPEGSSVYKDSSVKLFISTNEQLIQVPSLLNLDLGIALQTLDSLNILYEISYIRVDYSIQENSILSQFPEPFDQIAQNDKIILFVGQQQQ